MTVSAAAKAAVRSSLRANAVSAMAGRTSAP